MVLDATRMTKWNNTKLDNHTDMVKVVLTGKEQSVRFTRGYGSFRMRPFVKGSQRCFNCQKFGHHARTCRLEVYTCIYCAWRHHSHQCKDNKQRTLKFANCGQERATKSCLCQREWTPSRKQRLHKRHNEPHTNKTAGHQLLYAWVTLTVQEVEKRSFSHQPSIPITKPVTIEQPMEVSQKQSNPTARSSIPKTDQIVGKCKGGSRLPTNHQCMDKSVRTINEGFSDSYVSEQDKTVPLSQSMQPITSHKNNTNKPKRNKWIMY